MMNIVHGVDPSHIVDTSISYEKLTQSLDVPLHASLEFRKQANSGARLLPNLD